MVEPLIYSFEAAQTFYGKILLPRIVSAEPLEDFIHKIRFYVVMKKRILFLDSQFL